MTLIKKNPKKGYPMKNGIELSPKNGEEIFDGEEIVFSPEKPGCVKKF